MKRKRFFCHDCDSECDLIEEDDGGYEEVWGAKVWCSALTTKSDCCNDEEWVEVGSSDDMDLTTELVSALTK